VVIKSKPSLTRSPHYLFIFTLKILTLALQNFPRFAYRPQSTVVN